jgi:hypothetical protein
VCLPGVIGSAVNGSASDETRRLGVEGCPADRTSKTGRVPRPTGYLNEETVRNEFSTGGAHSRYANTATAYRSTATANTPDATETSGRVDRTVGR